MKTYIKVQNLRCGGCANTITAKLSEIPNISDINVDIDSSIITFSTEKSDNTLIVKQKLATLGYPSINDDNGVLLKAKSIISCATGKLK